MQARAESLPPQQMWTWEPESVAELHPHGMMAQVFLEIGETQQELEKIVALRRLVHPAALRKRLHHEIGIGQQPVQGTRVYGPALLAEFKRLSEARADLFDEVIQAEDFLCQSLRHALVATVYLAREQWSRGQTHTPHRASRERLTRCKLRASCPRAARDEREAVRTIGLIYEATRPSRDG